VRHFFHLLYYGHTRLLDVLSTFCRRKNFYLLRVGKGAESFGTFSQSYNCCSLCQCTSRLVGRRPSRTLFDFYRSRVERIVQLGYTGHHALRLDARRQCALRHSVVSPCRSAVYVDGFVSGVRNWRHHLWHFS
jgi:hypothetical protein